MYRFSLAGAVMAVLLFAVSAQSQEFAVPNKPNKKALFAKNAEVHNRDPAGYITLSSTIVVPLDGENYGVLYGVLAGKRKGDSFHYFENPDLGFICIGTGKTTKDGGLITNECFLNGGSTGKQNIVVPSYGKISGKLLFNISDNGENLGLAAMKWGSAYPNYKKVYKFLKANGG